MSAERPLDALLPELTTQQPALDAHPVHPRVLHVPDGEGYAWVVALWRNPGGAAELHKSVRAVIEATMLAELCRAPRAGEELTKRPTELRLAAFDNEPHMADALRAFGLTPAPADLDVAMRTLQQEADAVGMKIASAPLSLWRAKVRAPANERDRRIEELHGQLIEAGGAEVWGETPGLPSRRAAALLNKAFDVKITPDDAGLDLAELLLVSRDQTGVVRWIPPLFFQALCDLVGVVVAAMGLSVDWAECQADDNGFAEAPLLRVRGGERAEHLPIALHLMRWCVMPIQEGEDIPPLSAWVADEFGAWPT